MMQSIRNQAKSWVFGILFGLLILSFAIWGIGDIFRGGGQDTVVAEVGDTEISTQAFLRQYQRELSVVQARLGGQINPELLNQLGLGTQVISQMVERSLFDLATRDLGFTAADDTVAGQIRTDPNFQRFGEFSRDLYQRTLMSNGMSEAGYEAMLRRDLARNQLIEAVVATGGVPDTLLAPLLKYRSERRVAQLITVPASRFEAPEADDTKLEAFHKANEDQFMAPAYRRVTAIYLAPEDLMAEIEVSDDQVEESFESRRDEFETPEKRTVEQMLFADEDSARSAHASLGQGKTFTDVAKEVGNQHADLTLGTFTRKSIPLPELTEPIFALAKGAHSEPVQSPLGWHVLRVTEIEAGESKTLDEVRDTILRDLRRERALDSIYEVANGVEDELAGGSTLEEASAELNVRLVKIDAIDQQGNGTDGKPAANLPQAPEFVRAAFSTETGQESDLIETDSGAAFILKVEDETPAAVRPLADVRGEVLQAWQADQRRQQAKAEADRLADLIKAGSSIETVASDHDIAVVTSPPFTRDGRGVIGNPEAPMEREMVAKIFEVTRGEVSVVASGDDYVVGQLKEILTSDSASAEADRKAAIEQLGQAMATDRLAEFAAALRARYPVEINQGAITHALQ